MSSEPDRAEVTRILDALARPGAEPRTARDLLPLVYAELRPLAARKLGWAGPRPARRSSRRR
jgi:hypothetical protein